LNLGDIIDEARVLLQDTNATMQRFTDAQMLEFGNQTLRRIALLRPDLFAYIGEITCTVGAVLQSMPSDSLRIMEIFRIKDGAAVRETNREVMDQSYPSWTTTTNGAAVNWMRHPRNPNKFFIYPPAPTAQILIGEYAQAPQVYDGTTEIDLLPDAYYVSVLDGIVWLAESIDNEHVNSGRAAMFQKAFAESLAINLQGRETTDTESSGYMKERYK
jgi:hypothetical protein